MIVPARAAFVSSRRTAHVRREERWREVHSRQPPLTHYGVDNLTALLKTVKADPDLLRRCTSNE